VRPLGLVPGAIVAIAAGWAFSPSVAQADAFDRIGDTSPAYASFRPVALMNLAKAVGVGELPEVQKLRQQLGGIDPLSPALLAPTGLDVAAPVALSLFEAAGPKRHHHRAVAGLRDRASFTAFFAGVAASQQLPMTMVTPDSPMGKQSVIATVELPKDGGNMVLRVTGDVLIIDLVAATQGKPMAMAEIIKRYPIDVAKPFVAEKGARRLFTPDAALVMYADGRRLPPVLDLLLAKGPKQCKQEWARAGSSFDDVAVSVAVDPDGLKAQLAWGTQSGPPLGGLKLSPRDDGGIDVDLVSRQAPAVMALYAASLAPFQALKRGGPMESMSTLVSSVNRCGPPAWVTLLVRSWPQALGALISGGKKGTADPMMSSVLANLGALRNTVLMLRDANQQAARYAVTATFDPAARQTLELFLSTATGGGTATAVGKRKPTVYRLAVEGMTAVAAVEALPGGPVAFTIADSDDTLGWAFRTATRMPGAPAPVAGATPVAAMHLDTVQIAKLVPFLKLGKDAQQGWDLLARLRRLDAELVPDGDLFRLTVRAPLKPARPSPPPDGALKGEQ
jgi:hypothetical protein